MTAGPELPKRSLWIKFIKINIENFCFSVIRRKVVVFFLEKIIIITVEPACPAQDFASNDAEGGEMKMKIKTICLVITLIIPTLATGQDYPEPVGRFKIGASYFVIEDTSRLEYYTPDPDDHRWIGVHAWYPAATTEGCTPKVYIDEATAQAMYKYLGIPAALFPETPSLAYIDAPARLGTYPVVIFNHGYASYPTQNGIVAESLASSGYVVLAIGHPYESLYTDDGKGGGVETLTSEYFEAVEQYINPDPEAYVNDLALAADTVRAAQTSEDYQAAIRAFVTGDPVLSLLGDNMELWIEDTAFLIDSLYAINLGEFSEQLAGKLDIDRIGLFGHSFGGALNVEMAVRGGYGIDAGISYDGPGYFWEEQEPRTLTMPFLSMMATNSSFAGDAILDTTSLNDGYVHTAPFDAYAFSYKGAGHMNYTDLTYLSGGRLLGLLGPTNGNRAGETIIKYTLQFFDAYLKCKDRRFTLTAPREFSIVSEISNTDSPTCSDE